MKRRKSINLPPHEFELDLAPLLAVMVKLVPVLLISSAFVQHKTVDVGLPAFVQQAKENQEKKQISIEVEITENSNIQIVHREKDKIISEQSITAKESKIDLDSFYGKIFELKSNYPELFSIQLKANGKISLDKVISVMDNCRKSKNKDQTFKMKIPGTGETKETQLMFPDVVFTDVDSIHEEG